MTTQKRYAVLGTTQDHNYGFFSPMVCLAWRRVGYEPVVFFVGDFSKEIGKLALEYTALLDVEMCHINSMDDVEDATLAQSVRLHAAASPMFNDDDILIPCDADLIPIRKEFYYKHDITNYDIASYYSNGYPGEDNHFPSNHISMTAEKWREVMEIETKDIWEAMRKTFMAYNLGEKIENKRNDQHKNWGHVWFIDEHSVSGQIVKSRFYPDRFQRITRDGHPPKDRLDRACWPNDYDIQQYTDCHSLRPGWATSNWIRLRPMYAALFHKDMEWIDQYRQKYLDAMGCDQ